MKKIQFTQEGLENLKKELDEIISVKRPSTVERLTKARAMGDLRENSEYAAAKEELAFVEGRIQELQMLIEHAEISTSSSAEGIVDIGCKVVVDRDGKNEEFTVVGEFEANPMEKKLSHTSPIGGALLGKKKGDTVTVEVPAGKLVYKIVEVKRN